MSARVSLFASMISSALLLAASSAAAAGAVALHLPVMSEGRVRTCATPGPTVEEIERLRASLQRAPGESAGRPVAGTIQIAFHVIHDGDQGSVSGEQILEQVRELNHNFLGTGYRFSLASVDRTDSRRWFKVLPATGDEKHMKESLAIDPAHRLNVYSAAPRDLLGWACLPFSLPEEHVMHGVVIHHGSLPGGPIESYNLGRTLTHEVGHYLGLFHTSLGGCEEPGDHVEDTPPEAVPNYACPESRNTCPSPGEDPMHNYMDYSIDECYTEFTSGQDARMDAIVPLYRPSLLDARLAFAPSEALPAAGSPATPRTLSFRGAWPNPFQHETVLRFSLPNRAHVKLRVYDVAGHLVANVMDARLPAGDHSAPFRGAGLPAGLYFASLRVDGTSFTRSLMRVP